MVESGAFFTNNPMEGYDKAKAMVRQRLRNKERIAASQILWWRRALDILLLQPPFLPIGDSISLARWHALTSMVPEERCKKTPLWDSTCPCDAGKVETIQHVMLCCCFFSETHLKLIFPLLEGSLASQIMTFQGCFWWEITHRLLPSVVWNYLWWPVKSARKSYIWNLIFN